MKLVFLISLPRSGSTYLQRLMMRHPEISSVAESWLLLPLVGMTKSDGTATEYSHQTSVMAIEDLIRQLPGGQATFDKGVRDFVETIFAAVAKPGATHFIDKTPRNYLIVAEIRRVFPEARFVFLVRNPLHVLSSIVGTFGGDSLNQIFRNLLDVRHGPGFVAKGYELAREQSILIRYEDLVRDPGTELGNIFRFIGLEMDCADCAEPTEVPLPGRMGDPKRFVGRDQVGGESKNHLLTPIRKMMAKFYLSRILDEYLVLGGYSRGNLVDELRGAKCSEMRLFDDLRSLIKAFAAVTFKANVFFSKNMKWARGKFID